METTILTPEAAMEFLKKREETIRNSTTISTDASLIQVGQKIMSNGVEYEVTFYNSKNDTFSLTMLDKKEIELVVNQKIILNQKYYKVVYINLGQKRINVKAIR